MDDEDALHLQRFHWFPPGDFTAEWLTTAAKKLVKKGAEKELESGRDPLFPTEDRGADEVPGGPSTIEQRLSALRGPGRRVSFPHTPLWSLLQDRQKAERLPRMGLVVVTVPSPLWWRLHRER